MAFGNYYAGKTVLVTGHTGFKGSWLVIWLESLGAKVIGYALDPITKPSNFHACGLAERITHIVGDVRDHAHLQRVVAEYKPDVILHLAAQALVLESVRNPRETFEINVMGTVNVLDVALRSGTVGAVVCVTSDKCYRNVGWDWGYREIDPLGGEEAYSSSKACAEIGVGTYQLPSFQSAVVSDGRCLPIASARAGNVVGGGDWSAARLVPDVIRAIHAGETIRLRSPNATRPWQHVLEPLSGYLWLGARLATAADPTQFASGWNFGPIDRGVHPVLDVVHKIVAAWPAPLSSVAVDPPTSAKEAMLLALDCSKARSKLGWSATWNIDQTIMATTDWYRHFYHARPESMLEFTRQQVATYLADARDSNQTWAQ